MTTSWLMGIDLGGSGARCLLLNPGSGALFSGSGSWQFRPAHGTFGSGFDIDLEEVWAVLGQACRQAVQQAGISPAQVSAVAVSAMRFATVLLDEDGNSLLAVPNRDARAAAEYFDIAARLGPQLLAATGTPPLPLHAAARLLWLKNQRPEDFARVRTVFGLGEWLNFRLSDVRAIDASLGSATGLFSLNERAWCWPLIDQLELPRDIFPTVIDAGSPLGTLSEAAATHLGLRAGTTVGMGGADTQCSLLGSALLDGGESAVVAGTTAPVQVVQEQAVFDPAGKSLGAHHVVPGRWVLESNGGAMGESVTFMAAMLFPDAPQPELRLLAEAALSEPGAAGMLSTVGAEVMNMQSPSLPVGHITMSHLVGASDPRRHLVRALVEGCGCAVRANLEQLDSVLAATGRPATRSGTLTLCGGMSRSGFFAQLLADITERTVAVPASHQASALGAALCAAVAAGHFADFSSACSALCTERTEFNPEAARAELHQQLYANWSRFRTRAEASTAPVAVEHVLPHVLKEPPAAQSVATRSGERLQALVSASFDEASLARLREHMDVDYASFRETRRLLTGPSLVSALQGKQVFVTEVDVLDAAALAELPDLRVVAACRGNAVNVDVEACTAFGVPVLFAPGRNAIAVADLTVGFMISLARKLPAASEFLKQEDCTEGNIGKMGQAFNQLQGSELWRKTVGLVGLGAVGRAVARRLAGFGVEILVADPFISAEQAALASCRLTDLDTLLRSSDFVSLHAAVTAQTTGMIAAPEFAKMKSSAFFINTARAALVDEQALVDALEENRIAGAALDTFAVEPPGSDHPLVQHPAVISTPHSAGNTVEVANHQGESIATALLQLLHGESPHCVLNPDTLAEFDWRSPRPQAGAAELERLRSRSGPAVTDLQRDAKAAKARRPVSRRAPANQRDTSTPARTNVRPAETGKMRAILERFCAGMAADPSLLAFSGDQEVTLHFTLTDLGLDFHLSLNQGTVTSALGAAPDGAEVRLEMRGTTIDGMFMGTLDTMDAAMNGEIAFSGDAAKAMTLQQIEADMERLYTAARTSVGNPFA